MKASPTQPARPRSVLFIQHMLPLGCLVHMTPLFEAIKRSRPEIEITVATRGIGLQVLRHSPHIDHLIETPDPSTQLFAAVFALRNRLRQLRIRPDCVLTGAFDQRTRFALLGLFGSSGWSGGYTQSPKLYRKPLAYDPGLSLIANNLRLAALIGVEPQPTEPHVYFSPADAEAAAALLASANPHGDPVVAFVTQNSGGQRTGWHIDRFVQVIRHAALERGLAVVYLGTAQDAPAIDAIRDAAGGIGFSLAGKTDVNRLAAVLALSDFAVSLDTGTMHVARSVQLPMVVLGPSWQNPLEWMPLGVPNVRILRGADRTGVPENYRLDEISADSVTGALDELLQQCPASDDARQNRLRSGLSKIDHLAWTAQGAP